MENLVSFFNCGRCVIRPNKNHCDFLVTTFSDVNDKIIPFFKKYPIYGVKSLYLADFCKVTELIDTKEHLTRNEY